MIRYKVNCKACQASKADPRLRKRIYQAAFKREDGDESIYQIADEVGLNRKRLYSHIQTHLTDTTETDRDRRAVIIAKKTEEFKAKAQKEQELAIEGDVVDTIEDRPAQIIVLDDYIAQGRELLAKGHIKINGNGLLAAIKVKNEWEAKRQQNKTDYLKTIYALAGGGKQNGTGTTEGSSTPEAPGLDSSGEGQANDLYQRATGS